MDFEKNCGKSRFRHPSDEDPPHGSDDGSADASRDQQDRKIPTKACGTHEKGGTGKLSQIVADAPRHAYPRGGENRQATEQKHDGETQKRP